MGIARPLPIFATERTAAALLDMKPDEFRALVDAGALPPPSKMDRWDVEHLARIMRGDDANMSQVLTL